MVTPCPTNFDCTSCCGVIPNPAPCVTVNWPNTMVPVKRKNRRTKKQYRFLIGWNRVLGARCWVLGSGCWVMGTGCWIKISEYENIRKNLNLCETLFYLYVTLCNILKQLISLKSSTQYPVPSTQYLVNNNPSCSIMAVVAISVFGGRLHVPDFTGRAFHLGVESVAKIKIRSGVKISFCINRKENNNSS